jgi:hypothetical protein
MKTVNDVPQSYYMTKHWKTFRDSVLIIQNKIHEETNSCELCGDFFDRLEVHHFHYETLFAETIQDVIVVCKTCHAKLDELRKICEAKGVKVIRKSFFKTTIKMRATRQYGFDRFLRMLETV